MKRASELGIKEVRFEFDFADVMKRVHKVIEEIEPHDSVERYSGLGVECINGHAEILDPYRVRVGERILSTKNIILALGGSPWIPPIKGIEKIACRTSENLWKMTTLPKRFVVLGGGPIGSEWPKHLQG
jgi:pyruvate/2-oxoglutarate dehydrogenase complex dihydrolipoamide dehydrogenase (E3) component